MGYLWSGAGVCSLLGKDTRSSYVKGAVEALKSHDKEFDAIAFRGLSGAVMACMVGYATDKYLIAVRKTGEQTYSAPREVEYAFSDSQGKGVFPDLATVRWIILDDSTATGKTINDMYTKCLKAGFSKPVAAIFYYGLAGSYNHTTTLRDLRDDSTIIVPRW